MLQVDAVHAYYGESHVLQGVSLTAEEGKIVALLGRNGAGKTTTLRAIMGLTPPRQGRVIFAGRDITGLPPFAIARAGVGFDSRRPPAVQRTHRGQNLRLGLRPSKTTGAWTMERVSALFPALRERADRPAKALSGGEQQMLKFGRCLLGQPRLLLLDEPSEGLAPMIVRQIAELLRQLGGAGLSMLMCEQNAKFALAVADTAYLIEKGSVRHSGPAAEMAMQPELKEFLAV